VAKELGLRDSVLLRWVEQRGAGREPTAASRRSTTQATLPSADFTDPQSRIMKSKDGFVQAYNAQIAVDAEAQIIVAQDVTQSASDCAQLLPMTDAVEANLGRKPEQVSADAGYCSEKNLAGLEARTIDAYVATCRARDAVAGTEKGEAAPAPSSAQPDETPTRIGLRRSNEANRNYPIAHFHLSGS
jgi:hypothetical protein